MKIEMYTKAQCPFCSHAKALLLHYGVEILEHDVTHDAVKISEMVDRAVGNWTVPQIILDGVPIGGCDDLRILHQSGQLGNLLGLVNAETSESWPSEVRNEAICR